MKHAAGTPTVLRATLEKVRQESHKAVQRLERERRDLQIQLKNDDIELRALNDLGENEANESRRAEILERISLAERRMTQVATELVPLLANSMTDDDVAAAIADFGRVWDALSIREQVRIVELLIEQVQYDGVQKKVAITFRPLGNASVSGGAGKRERRRSDDRRSETQS